MRRGSRGYTFVELMMALTVLGIGVSGVIAMQKVTVSSNQHSKNLALATHIAEGWAEQLTIDSGRWNYPNATISVSDLPATLWLNAVNDSPGQWVLPPHSAEVTFGPAFDALGNVTTTAAQTVFCTHIRLSWLYPGATFNGVMRADIRVFWPREGRGAIAPCATVTPAAVTAGLANYHFVHHSTAVRQNTAFASP
ncbi:MAG TPA: prepilin-type N-terminal cleavage/methylation domain-containing protein [Polyangiaceae bacterium]|nr:prepilin-type N-terminal cleavage/methylation domain-containing protein [Polyangiaceae bacterium]